MNVALTLAGAVLIAIGVTSNDWPVYLWAPGVFCLTLAFTRATHRPDPRPGYINDQEDR